MANTTIVNSWSLMEFFNNNGGRLRVAPFVNKETGEQFHSCVFGTDNLVFVAFSSKLGELTPTQIASRKDELRVVELESGHFSLCVGNSTWEDVTL